MWRSKVWSSVVICHLVLNVAVTDTAIWKSRRGSNDHETSENECWQCLIYASTWRDIHSRRRWNLIMTKSLSHFSLLPKWIKNNEVKLCTSLFFFFFFVFGIVLDFNYRNVFQTVHELQQNTIFIRLCCSWLSMYAEYSTLYVHIHYTRYNNCILLH